MSCRPIPVLFFLGMVAAAEIASGQGFNPGGAQPGSMRAEPASSVPYAPAAMSGALVDPSRRLQQGDQLSFKIEQDDDPAISLVVTQSGDVLVEPFGSVRVAGLTIPQAASEIKRYLERDYYFTATVRLNLERANMAATMGHVYLSGQVGRVGAMPIYPEKPLMLSQAILDSGGFGKFADSRKVKVTRAKRGGGTETFTVDVKEVIERGRVDQDVLLQEGDRVHVPETFFKR